MLALPALQRARCGAGAPAVHNGAQHRGPRVRMPPSIFVASMQPQAPRSQRPGTAVPPDAGPRPRSVIKTILQFCKENSLPESFAAIQRECQVSLNTVESLEGFVADITAGRWDVVLPAVAQLKLPRTKLEDLYELVRPRPPARRDTSPRPSAPSPGGPLSWQASRQGQGPALLWRGCRCGPHHGELPAPGPKLRNRSPAHTALIGLEAAAGRPGR